MPMLRLHTGIISPIIGVNIDIESRLDATQCTEDLGKLNTYRDLEQKIENYVL